MRIQKIIFALIFTFFSLAANTATDIYRPLTATKCKPLIVLNHATRSHLNLTDSNMRVIRKINHQYLSSRKRILDTPEMLGQNTALLSCWDKWRLSLNEHLTETQMNAFMQWQSKVDLLSVRPF